MTSVTPHRRNVSMTCRGKTVFPFRPTHQQETMR